MDDVMQGLEDVNKKRQDALDKEIAMSASIITMLETEGGKNLLTHLDDLERIADPGIAAYINEKGQGAWEVDSFAVAKAVGQVTFIKEIQNFFSRCKRNVEEAAKINSSNVV